MSDDDSRNGISRKNAEQAVRTLIQWAGDDPTREGLKDTPERVAKSYEEFFCGYDQEPEALLDTVFGESYGDIVLLKGIRFESHCEHHLVPIVGTIDIAYIPKKSVVGISKLARLADCYAKRLQLQERMTKQIAQTIDQTLKPEGVAVAIRSNHHCISTRGVHKYASEMVTLYTTGVFDETRSQDSGYQYRQEFLRLIGL